MWSSAAIPSSSSYLSSVSDYSDGYYSSDDSDSEDEADDILCDAASGDMNDLMKKGNIKNKNNKKKRRPISPTSCADFENCEHYEHDRPAKRCCRRRRNHGSKHVTFARDPVADVRYRPRTPWEDKRMLFYSKRDISGFRRDYYDWLDEGHDPSELYELNEEDVEQEADDSVISTSSPTTPPKKKTTTCVTPDNSSEDEDGDDAYEEEEED